MAELREWLEARGLGRYATRYWLRTSNSTSCVRTDGCRPDGDRSAGWCPQAPAPGDRGTSRTDLRDDAVHGVAVDSSDNRAGSGATATDRAFLRRRRSTHLAETLDAEDLRNLLLSFQKICAEVVQHHEGQIGLFIGDGVTAYFGYPRAHEDPPQRAVQAGLDIMAGLTELGRRSRSPPWCPHWRGCRR